MSEFGQPFEAIRKMGPVLGITALLAGGVSNANADELIMGKAQAVPEQGIVHRHSSMNLQVILNRIHRIAIPLDQEASIQPTSAFMLPSSVGFRTDCSYGDAGYRYYKVTPLGTGYEPCGRGIPYLQKSQFNQYIEPLNKIGSDIRRSVGFTAVQVTYSIQGNRKSVSASFDCSPQPSSSTVMTGETAVRQIVLSRTKNKHHHKSRHPRYTLGTITLC